MRNLLLQINATDIDKCGGCQHDNSLRGSRKVSKRTPRLNNMRSRPEPLICFLCRNDIKGTVGCLNLPRSFETKDLIPRPVCFSCAYNFSIIYGTDGLWYSTEGRSFTNNHQIISDGVTYYTEIRTMILDLKHTKEQKERYCHDCKKDLSLPEYLKKTPIIYSRTYDKLLWAKCQRCFEKEIPYWYCSGSTSNGGTINRDTPMIEVYSSVKVAKLILSE